MKIFALLRKYVLTMSGEPAPQIMTTPLDFDHQINDMINIAICEVSDNKTGWTSIKTKTSYFHHPRTY